MHGQLNVKLEIYIGNKSSLIRMDFKIYCILHFKAFEFPCHKFSTSSSFVVVLLRVI